MCNVSSVKSRVPGLSLGYVQAAACVRHSTNCEAHWPTFPCAPLPPRCLDCLARLQKAPECTETQAQAARRARTHFSVSVAEILVSSQCAAQVMTQDTLSKPPNPPPRGSTWPGDKWLVEASFSRGIKCIFTTNVYIFWTGNIKCQEIMTVAHHTQYLLWMCIRKIYLVSGLCIECKQTIHRGSGVIHDLQTAAASQLLNAAKLHTLFAQLSFVLIWGRGWDLGRAEVRQSHPPARHCHSSLLCRVTGLYTKVCWKLGHF